MKFRNNNIVKLIYKYCCVFVLLCFTTGLKAQELTATVSRPQILIGEQITYEVKLSGINKNEVFLAEWIAVPDTFNHFEIIKAEKPDTFTIENTLTVIQSFTLTSFDSGQWTVPPFSIQLRNTSTQQIKTLSTPVLTVEVLPVDVSSLKDYHEIKEIIPVEDIADKNWLLIGAIALTVIVIAVVLMLLQKRKKHASVAITNHLPAYEWAIAALKDLKQQQQTLNTFRFFLELDGIYRNYLQRSGIADAMHTTADELMVKMDTEIKDASLKTRFYQTIRLINAVKFARHKTAETEKETAISSVTEVIEHIEKKK